MDKGGARESYVCTNIKPCADHAVGLKSEGMLGICCGRRGIRLDHYNAVNFALS